MGRSKGRNAQRAVIRGRFSDRARSTVSKPIRSGLASGPEERQSGCWRRCLREEIDRSVLSLLHALALLIAPSSHGFQRYLLHYF